MRLASFEAIIGALHGAKVRYLIAGGLAVGAHGYLRSTRDVDLVVRLVAENVDRLFAALQGLGYRAMVSLTPGQFADAAWRERWMKDNGVPVMTFRSDRHPETPVKVFAAEPFPFDDEYEKALVKPLHGAIPVRLVCIETLIQMKEASGRLADRADAEQLRLTLKVDAPLDVPPGEIDWRLASWEGSRREQFRRWAVLPLEDAITALEEMEEITERFREMREQRKFHTSSSAPSPATEARESLEPAADEVENEPDGLEAGDRTLACAAAGGTGPHPPQPHSPERGPEYGFRGGTGGASDAGGGARPAHGAARVVETRLGVITHGELAPHLARNVLELEERIEDGQFSCAALDERLVLEFHGAICGDLMPRLGGWRRVNVTVGEHEPPQFFKVHALVREYGLDLQARLVTLTGRAGELMLEALAFAEGRLLSIHPFADFNGRATRVWLREVLRRLDLPPVCLAPVEPAARRVYLSALGAGDRSDWGPLIEVWRGRFEEVLP